jgi:hypothetical protein
MLSGDFHLDLCQFDIITTSYGAQIEMYPFSQDRIIVKCN